MLSVALFCISFPYYLLEEATKLQKLPSTYLLIHQVKISFF